MRWLLTSLLVLAAAVGAALLLHRYPGHVAVELGPWLIETSAAIAVIGLALVVVAIYLLLRVLGLVAKGPRVFARNTVGRRADRARRALERGLIEMAEGRWEAAEKLLVRDAEWSQTSLLNYLGAARAAQQIGAYERRDRYLRAAIEDNPEADVAVSLTQAELQLAHHQNEHALATLNRLHALQPRHTYVMKLLSRLYLELEDWEQLAAMLPELRRSGAVSGQRLQELEHKVADGRLAAAPADADALRAIWSELPKSVRESADAIQRYARRLQEAGAADEAEKRLRQYLNKHWDERLVREYGLLRTSDTGRQLGHAEHWAKSRSQSPLLLLTLGRLSVRQRLWGKARSYFESSLGAQPRAETCHELAELLEQLGETGVARDYYRQGLELAVQDMAERDPHTATKTETEHAVGNELPAPAAATA